MSSCHKHFGFRTLHFPLLKHTILKHVYMCISEKLNMLHTHKRLKKSTEVQERAVDGPFHHLELAISVIWYI